MLQQQISVKKYYTKVWCGNLGFWGCCKYIATIGTTLYSANLGYFAGLQYIHASLGSMLSQGEAPFTIFLSIIILGHVFCVWDQLGIVLSFIGIVLITVPPILQAKDLTPYDDGTMGNEALEMINGVVLTLVGAL